jgi:hypothetical protein
LTGLSSLNSTISQESCEALATCSALVVDRAGGILNMTMPTGWLVPYPKPAEQSAQGHSRVRLNRPGDCHHLGLTEMHDVEVII